MELIIIFISILIATVTSFLVNKRSVIESVTIIASLIAFIGSVSVAIKVANTGTYSPYSFFSVDALGAILILVITLVGLAATTYSVKYLREETAKNIVGFKRIKQYQRRNCSLY